MRKKDILYICDKHSDCLFLAFTNGGFLYDTFTAGMLEVKNFIPILTLDADKEETNLKRGKKFYDLQRNVLKLLKKKRLFFCVSCCYTSENHLKMSSESYLDDLIENGAMFVCFFPYIQSGINENIKLITTLKQREYIHSQLNKFQEIKPIFMVDFNTDGKFSKGNIAGGNIYFQIGANGTIKPYSFVYFSEEDDLKMIDNNFWMR
jgi:MoaA/NifB/PqqE/SkfB family radical SAM enzyme